MFFEKTTLIKGILRKTKKVSQKYGQTFFWGKKGELFICFPWEKKILVDVTKKKVTFYKKRFKNQTNKSGLLEKILDTKVQ